MKKNRILLLIILVLALILAGIVYWQYNNFKAVYYSISCSDDDIDKLISDNNKEVKDYIEQTPGISVRPSEEVEEKLHGEGAITDEELVGIITGKDSVQNIFGVDIGLNTNKNFIDSSNGNIIGTDALIAMKEQNKTDAFREEDKSPPDEEKADNSEEISNCIARLYVLKSSFVGRLDALYGEAISYYSSLSAEQKKNAKSEILKKFYSRGTALEAECDSQVAAIMSELKALLKAEGSDFTLINKIQAAYDNEKSLKKAQYLNKL